MGKLQIDTAKRREARVDALIKCTSLDLIQRSVSDYVIHSTAGIFGEVDSLLSRTRAALAPAEPVLRILDNSDPLAKLAAMR